MRRTWKIREHASVECMHVRICKGQGGKRGLLTRLNSIIPSLKKKRRQTPGNYKNPSWQTSAISRESRGVRRNCQSVAVHSCSINSMKAAAGPRLGGLPRWECCGRRTNKRVRRHALVEWPGHSLCRNWRVSIDVAWFCPSLASCALTSRFAGRIELFYSSILRVAIEPCLMD